MKIGIDIDNTITNTLPILKEYCKRYNDDVVKRNLKMNDEGFNTSNLFKWAKEEEMDFCNKHLEEVVMKAPIKNNAIDIISKLKKDNHYIYIITSRRKPHFKDPYKLTEEFLKKNNILYDELIVECEDKNAFCINNHIDVMIDDEPQNIMSISKNIPVIVFNGIQNKNCRGNNIIKVDEWLKTYDIIIKDLCK